MKDLEKPLLSKSTKWSTSVSSDIPRWVSDVLALSKQPSKDQLVSLYNSLDRSVYSTIVLDEEDRDISFEDMAFVVFDNSVAWKYIVRFSLISLLLLASCILLIVA